MNILLLRSVLGSPIGLVTSTKTKMLKGSDGEKSNESDDETGNKQQRAMTAASASSTNAQNRSRPLFVTKVTSNDVLMGRGAITDNHEGNKRFRDLVRQRKQEYNLTSRHQTKQEISNHIVATIKSRGGAFLRKIESTEESDRLGVPAGSFAWTHASDDVVHLKVKQALRDKNSMKGNDSQQQTTVATKTVGAGEEMKRIATKASPTSVPVSANNRKGDKAMRSGAKKLKKDSQPSAERVAFLGESQLLPGNDRLSRMEQSLFLSSSPPRPHTALASVTHPMDTASSSGNSIPSGHLNIPYSSTSLPSENTSSFLASLSQQRIREQQQLEESLLASSSISSTGVGNANDLYQSVAYQQLLRRLVLQQSELGRASSFGSGNNNVLDYLRLLNDPAVAVQQQQMIQMQQQRQAAAAAMANSVSQQRTFSGTSIAAANDDQSLEQQLANLVRLRSQFQPTQGSTASTAFVGTGTGAEQPTNQNLMGQQSQSSTFSQLLVSNNIRNTDLTLPNRRILPAHNFGDLPTTSGLGNLNVTNQRSLIRQLDHQNLYPPGSQQSNLSDMMYRMDNSNNDRTNNFAYTGSQLDSQSVLQSNPVDFVSPKKLASPFMAKKHRDELADKMNKFGTSTARKSITSSPHMQSRNLPLKASVKIAKKRRSSDLSSSSSNVDSSDATTVSSNKRLQAKKGQS